MEAAGLAWPLPSELSDGALEAKLFPKARPFLTNPPVPDWAAIHMELKGKGVTLQLLWLEYK